MKRRRGDFGGEEDAYAALMRKSGGASRIHMRSHASSVQRAAYQPRWETEMTYLTFTEDRIYEAAVNRQLHPDSSNLARADYRFGRIGGERTRGHARRAFRAVRGLFSAMLEIIANAKTRRIERELRIRGIRYDKVKLDDDRFVVD